eukprot:SAG31_NODE_14327_length_813_cov_1.470588_2_plen_96_part_01
MAEEHAQTSSESAQEPEHEASERTALVLAKAELDATLFATPWAFLTCAAPSMAIWALGIIFGCYGMAKNGGHIPAGANTPPISFLGYKTPEYWLYA